jgi:hypothetical protein
LLLVGCTVISLSPSYIVSISLWFC